jgi:tRNA (guanine10-N2)-dimethyltransferase
MAKEEVAGLMEVLGVTFTPVFEDHLLYGLEVQGLTEKGMKAMGNRLGLTRTVGELIAGPMDDAEKVQTELQKKELEIPKGSFAVRPKRFKSWFEDVNATELAGELGGSVKDSTGSPVNLDNPDTTLDLFLSQNLYLSKRILNIERGSLEDRRPHLREHFSPISLHPKFARACINMARCGDNFLDPFCGTGGFLIEGGLMGLSVYGSDVDEDMLQGAEENLKQFGTDDYHLQTLDVGDCKEWREHSHFPKEGFDAVVADPPYGRSSSTAGEEIRSIYSRAFDSLGEIIRPGGHLMIILPREEDIELAKGRFELKATFEQYVHGSLTRYYCLMKKN